jgi:hypothetical protein
VPGRDSQAHDGATLLRQSIKCPYPRARAGVLVREPRARRNPLEGGAGPRARRNLLEGGVSPRARRNLLEGGVSPRARRNLIEGPLTGTLRWAAGATAMWAVLGACV